MEITTNLYTFTNLAKSVMVEDETIDTLAMTFLEDKICIGGPVNRKFGETCSDPTFIYNMCRRRRKLGCVIYVSSKQDET